MTAPVETRIEKALIDYVQELELEGEPPIAWENVSFPAGGGEKPPVYVGVRHFRNDNARLYSKGSNPHLRQGILQLTVMVPIDDDEGTKLATRLAGSIAEQFPADLDLFEDEVKVTIQKAPSVGSGLRLVDEARWAVPVAIRYQSFS